MSSTTSEEPLNVVLIGVGAVGKTCFLQCYTKNWFPKSEYIPTSKSTIFHTTRIPINNTPRTVHIWDTPRLQNRKSCEDKRDEQDTDECNLAVRKANVIILTLSVTSPSSLPELRKAIPDTRIMAPQAKLLVLGLKCDLRGDAECHRLLQELNLDFVSHEDAEEFVKEIGAGGYVEAEKLTQDEAWEIFEAAFRLLAELRLDPGE